MSFNSLVLSTLLWASAQPVPNVHISQKPVFHYTDFFQLSFIFNSSIQHALELGPGESLTKRSIRQLFPDVTYAQVTDVNELLNAKPKSFDAVFINSYKLGVKNPNLPTSLVTLEFLKRLKSQMTDNAVLAINLTDAREQALKNMTNWVGLTASRVFKKVFLFQLNPRDQQVVLFATDNPKVTTETLRIRAISRPLQVAKLKPTILGLAALISEYQPQGFNLQILNEEDNQSSALLDGLK